MLLAEQKLFWRSYIVVKTLLITKQVQMIGQQKFAAIAPNLGKKAFVVYMAYLGSKMWINQACEAPNTFLLANKVIVWAKYSDFDNIFFKKVAVELYKRFAINKYLINLKSIKQPPYSLIYSLRPIELEIFKTFIKTNLANSFIWLFKLFAGIRIFFI